MTLKIFIKTIKETGEIPNSLKNIASELFSYAGLHYSDETIRAALYKKNKTPKCNQGSINEQGFFLYFEKRTISTWPKMQEAFGKLDETGLIDRNTTDRNIFFESLLVLFYEIHRLVPVSLRNILPPKSEIFGREKELEQLSDIFRDSNYAILSGIGGIGKSCVSLAYAHSLMEHGHWTVQHIICENADTLQNAIIKLQFIGLTDISNNKKDAAKKNFERRISCLKNSIKQVLIILDNLNRHFTSEDRDVLGKLIECGNHVRFIITSRSRLVDDKRCVVNLSPLDDDTLLRLYAYHRFENPAEHKDYMVQHNEILMKIFSKFERHTLMIILFAKLPSKLFMEEHKLYDRLSSGRNLSFAGMSIGKDGKTVDIPAEGMVKALFDTSNLTEREKSIMRHMSIIPPAGIEVKLFEGLTHHSRVEILNLKQSNWIILDEEKMTIRLHPLICETILSFEDTKPTVENCDKFIYSVKKQRSMFEEGSSAWHMYNKILLCFAENVHLRSIASSGMPDRLIDYYRNPLLFINKLALERINDKTVDGRVPLCIPMDKSIEEADGDD